MGQGRCRYIESWSSASSHCPINPRNVYCCQFLDSQSARANQSTPIPYKILFPLEPLSPEPAPTT